MLFRIKIRLYRPQDIDLIILKEQGYDIVPELKNSLLAFSNKESYVAKSSISNDIDLSNTKRVYQMHIMLDSRKENENNAINVLKAVYPRYRCSFLKLLLRNSLSSAPILELLEPSIFLNDLKNKKKDSTTKIPIVKKLNLETDMGPSSIHKTNEKEKEDANDTLKNESNEFDSLFNDLSLLK